MVNNKKPNIRFKEFTNDFYIYKLGEIGETYTGLSGKTKKDFGHGKGKFITYMNVYSNPVALPYMLDSIEIDNSQNEVQKGDVLFTTSSETPEEVGMSSIWLEEEKNVYLNSFCFGYRPKVSIYPYYLAYALRSSLIRKKIIYLAQGISRYNISKTKMMDIRILIPEISEQQKIGDLFKNIDSYINIHQQKYEKLKILKKTLLNKMFTNQISKVPQVRFKNFNENWITYKLNNVAKYRNGKAHEKNIDPKGKYIVVNSKFISTSGSERKFSNKNFSPLLKEEIAFVLSDVPNGKAIAKTFLIPENNKYTLNQRIAGITPKQTVYFYFLYISMNRNEYFLRLDDGVSQTNLSVTDVMCFEQKYPSINEQRKISEFFRKLDLLINLQKSKVEKLKQLKKSLLDKMFVQ